MLSGSRSKLRPRKVHGSATLFQGASSVGSILAALLAAAAVGTWSASNAQVVETSFKTAPSVEEKFEPAAAVSPQSSPKPDEEKLVAQVLAPTDAAEAASYMSQATAAYEDGRLELAVELYRRALAADPENPEVCYRLASVLEALGDLSGAIEAYESLQRVGSGGGWGHLATARLPTLRTRAALDKLAVAERVAQIQAFREAMRYLREADRFSPAASVRRKVCELYYQFAAEEIARSLEREMNARGLRTLAVGPIVPRMAGSEQNAAAFGETLLWSVFVRAGVAAALAEIPQGTVVKLIETAEASPTENPGIPGDLAESADCILMGTWFDSITIAAFHARSGEVLLMRKVDLLGSIPPRHEATAWHRLPSARDTNTELWAWVWADAQEYPAGARSVSLRVQVSQTCYVFLIHVGPDGSLELLLPSEARPDNFLQARQQYVIECPAGRPGTVSGVWMLASRTPPITWSDIAEAAADYAQTVLKAIESSLPRSPRNSWAISQWTWRVNAPQPPAAASEERRAPQE